MNLGRLVAKGYGQVGLADTRGAEKDEVLAPGDKVQRGELLDLAFWGGRGEAEVVILQRLGRGEAGHAHQRRRRPRAPAVAFRDQRVLKEVDEALFGFYRARRQGSEAFRHAGQLELLAQRDHPVRLQGRIRRRTHAAFPTAS